ncbi:hypothetical protein AB4Z46_34460 [Variovorax sp. M-6]|uniref:hypothetical protein n=1 Tax=Variovorax sp. M-6 TaxID=3233041 RepID=UPI003F9BCD6F
MALAADGASGAEFAIRWDPSQGGPRSMEEVVTLLDLPRGKRKSFTVRYFSVVQPTDVPPGSRAIARERSFGQRTEAMYKVRSNAPFPASGALATWRCPFEPHTKHKTEVDIGFTAEGLPKKSYSRSCDAGGSLEKVLPARFAAKPFGCTSQVLRIEADHIKIERWTLPRGEMSFEVSWNGEDTDADLRKFTRRVITPLMSRDIKPVRESKTELGSNC